MNAEFQRGPSWDDMKRYIAVLSSFANRWARHDEDCRAVSDEEQCDCGYDDAVRKLRDALRERYPNDPTLKRAVAAVNHELP